MSTRFAVILSIVLVSMQCSSVLKAEDGHAKASHGTMAKDAMVDLPWVTDVAPLGNGEKYVATTANGLLLRSAKVVMFSPSHPEQLVPLYEHPTAAWGIDASSDGKTIASVDYRGNLVVFDHQTSKATTHEEAFGRWCQTLCFAPGDQAVIAGNEAGELLIWNLAKSEVEKKVSLGEHSITDVVFSSDQSTLAVSEASGHVHRFAWPSMESKGKTKCGQGPAWSLAFAPEGDDLFVGSGDRKLYRVAASKDAKPTVVGSGTDWLTNLSVGNSGVIAAGQPNGEVHFFSSQGKESAPQTSLKAPSGVWSLCWNGSGKLLVGTRKDGLRGVAQSWTWAESQPMKAESAEEAAPQEEAKPEAEEESKASSSDSEAKDKADEKTDSEANAKDDEPKAEAETEKSDDGKKSDE